MRQGSGARAQGLGWWVLALVVMPVIAWAQGISLGDTSAVKKGHVVFLSEESVVEAGKPEVIELQFRVDEGFHINSHTPPDALLIATSFKVDPGDGVKVLGEEYPKGAAFKLGQGADAELLDVYQGVFRVRLRVVAAKGAQTLAGTLRYQACDNAACFPPRSLPVQVAITGK